MGDRGRRVCVARLAGIEPTTLGFGGQYAFRVLRRCHLRINELPALRTTGWRADHLLTTGGMFWLHFASAAASGKHA
jgi:hypothetical protein